MSYIGRNIKLIREAIGMSQQQLANAIGKARPSISQFENGANDPSTETIRRIAAALDVPVSQITDAPLVSVDSYTLDTRQLEIERIFRQLTDANKTVLLAAARAMLSSQRGDM